MRPSTVIQGVKDWASKLHPQLQLSPTESRRLLTALNSSFRDRLDEIPADHQHGKNGEQAVGSDSVRKPPERVPHSFSATLADGHLASVLTNPLLARANNYPNKLNHATATATFKRDRLKHPISLLEEYDRECAVTSRIALLCLEKLDEALKYMIKDQKREFLTRTLPGRRVLKWISTSSVTTIFPAERKRFVDLLVPVLIDEGSEDLMKQWLLLGPGPTEVSHGSEPEADMKAKDGHHRTQLRSRILRNYIGVLLNRDEHRRADASLDFLFEVIGLDKSSEARQANWQFVGFYACSLLYTLFTRRQDQLIADPLRYERFCEVVAQYAGKSTAFMEDAPARLALYHPKRPSADPAVALLRSVFQRTSKEIEGNPISIFHVPLDPGNNTAIRKKRDKAVSFVLKTVDVLQNAGRNAEAKEVLESTVKYLPNLELKLEKYQHLFVTTTTSAQRPPTDEALNGAYTSLYVT